MKKLDKLILKAFIGPFIATFFIALFVLMMQSLWKYIDDLVGKDLDLLTIGKFLMYASASLLILAIPIAILISSIMTFGNLGETFELVAIKSSGISLLRFMQPLTIVCVCLCVLSFYFANNVIPFANLKFKTLYYDIVYKKPALDLKEGSFYSQIPGFAIKVGKKEKDQQTIKDVVIYEQQSSLQDNSIVAQRGTMKISSDKKFLEFVLFDGFRYQEKGNPGDSATEFIKMGFKSYKKLIDVSSLKMNNTNDSVFQNDAKMLSLRQLTHNVRTVQKSQDSLRKKLGNDVSSYLRLTYTPAKDTLAGKTNSTAEKVNTNSTQKIKAITDIVPDSFLMPAFETATNIAANIRNSYQFTGAELQKKLEEERQSRIEQHRKFSLSVSCLILFFIGAPLGSIIRKGGMGMPLVVAIVFFIIFHLLNIFGEKFATEALVPVWVGMWLPIITLLPVGLFFTYKAMHDSQLFNKEFYFRLFKKIKPFWLSMVHRKNTPVSHQPLA
jgi:lipopolysaccharide export system permease protein